VLFRNGGPSATLSVPSTYNPVGNGAGAMPTPPAPPGQQPTCSSPCYNPSGAYNAYTRYHGSGNPSGSGSGYWQRFGNG